MSADEQRIAIAEACGFVFSLCRCDWYLKKPGCVELALGSAQNKEAFANYCPDYLGSLDAMHEAEKLLEGFAKDLFANLLCNLISPSRIDGYGDPENGSPQLSWPGVFQIAHATPAKRAKAFLQTIESWPIKPSTK